MVAWIYFVGTELELSQQTDLIFDCPGGGFICMGPEHHEERNLRWTIRTGRPVISFDYGKVGRRFVRGSHRVLTRRPAGPRVPLPLRH